MWNNRKKMYFLLVLVLATCLTAAAQSDDQSTCPVSKRIKKRIDSLTEHLEGQEKSVIFFVSVDFQGENGYGCILTKIDSITTGEKLFITETELRRTNADVRLLSMDRAIIINFFDEPKTYLTIDPGEDKREISHDNRMFLFAKINGQIVFNRYFCSSDYLSSKNQAMKSLFLKLVDIAD